jgi:hypothetical protein
LDDQVIGWLRTDLVTHHLGRRADRRRLSVADDSMNPMSDTTGLRDAAVAP